MYRPIKIKFDENDKTKNPESNVTILNEDKSKNEI